MVAVHLHEDTQQILDSPLFNGRTPDEKVRDLMETDCLGRIARYRRTDERLAQKYGMTFGEFVDRRIVKAHGYSWEVESDAMDWEMAVDGTATAEQTLQQLQKLKSREYDLQSAA